MQKLTEGMQWALIQTAHARRLLEELLVKYGPGCLTHWAALEIRDRVCVELVLK